VNHSEAHDEPSSDRFRQQQQSFFRVTFVVPRREEPSIFSKKKQETETMGKKKAFIDKKNASTYHLLHRSQRDVADDVLQQEDSEDAGPAATQAGMVLWPSPDNNQGTDKAVLGDQQSKLSEWRERLSQAGLLDEGPDRFLKPITTTGTFVGSSGRPIQLEDWGEDDPQQVAEETLMEVTRQMESIPLTADVMDEDIADALFADDIFEGGDMEELDDDFCLQAAQEPLDGDDEAFDFDRHIQELMEKAQRERMGGPSQQHEWGRGDKDFFSKLCPLQEQDEDEDYQATPGVVPALSPEEEQILCDRFEQTLLEYDSDEMGDCPEEDIHGRLALEGNAQVEAALDDFLCEKEDDVFMYGTRHLNTGGSGFSALIGNRMVKADQMNGQPLPDEKPETIQEILSQADQVLSSKPNQPPAEEIFIDGQSYYTERTRNPFDCESILSTYSNLDNNPVTIGSKSRRQRNNKNRTVTPEPNQHIQLSKKTGLPILSSADDDDDDDESFDDTMVSVNRGIARQKAETAEEKKARKTGIKKERQMARIQKKVTRQVYEEEFQKRAPDASSDVAGKTVFRYT
jgi:protein LTV1